MYACTSIPFGTAGAVFGSNVSTAPGPRLAGANPTTAPAVDSRDTEAVDEDGDETATRAATAAEARAALPTGRGTPHEAARPPARTSAHTQTATRGLCRSRNAPSMLSPFENGSAGAPDAAHPLPVTSITCGESRAGKVFSHSPPGRRARDPALFARDRRPRCASGWGV